MYLLVLTTLFCCSCSSSSISSTRVSLSGKSAKKIPQQILVQMFNLDIYSNAFMDTFNNTILDTIPRSEIHVANAVAGHIGKNAINQSPRTLLSNIHNLNFAQVARLEDMYYVNSEYGVEFDLLNLEIVEKTANAIVSLSHLVALLDAAVESIISNKELAIEISNTVDLDVIYDPKNPNYSVDVDAAIVRQFDNRPNFDTNSIKRSDVENLL
jgi:hypothetical protein